MADFATLVLGAKTDGLKDGERALDSLSATGARTEGTITRGSAAMSAGFKALAVSAVGILSAGAALRSLTGAIGRIDAMDEAAASIDGTVNSLRALQLATGEAGVGAGDLMASMQAMNRELAKAVDEGGPAADALAKIGLNAKDLAAMDADARLAAIADAMKAMNLTAGQSTAVLQDLGVRSKEFSVALLNGGGAIRAARSDIAALGLEMSQNTVDAAARTADALGRMGLVVEVIGNKAAEILAPALEQLANGFVNSMREGGALRAIIDGLGIGFSIAAGTISIAINTISAAFNGLRVALDMPERALNWLLGLGPTSMQAQQAIDQLTLAMGSEITQASNLIGAMGPGVTMTREFANVKLEQAKAHLTNMDAMRQEQVAMVQNTEAYKALSADILGITQNLENLRFLQSSQGGGEFAPNAYRQETEAALAALQASVAAQQQLLGEAANLSPAYQAAQQNIAMIEAALAASTGETITFGGNLVTAADIAARLAGTAGSINFSNANAGAAALANKLGISLQLARQLANLGMGDVAGSDGRGSQREGRMGVADFQAQNALKAATARATEYRSALIGVGSAGASAGKAVGGGAKEAVKELTDAEKATKKYQETMQGFVTDGIGKAVDWMVNGFKGGLKGLLGLFKSTISQMIAYAIKNKIMVSMGLGGGALGGAGGALAGVTGGGGASGMFSGIIGKIGGVFSSFISGASGLVTSLFGAGGGLGAAGTYLSSVMGGATASLGGFAAAAGAIALPLAAVAGIFSFFKKKTKELDTGMKVTVTGMNALVETFRTVQTSRFWGLKKKVSTSTTAASDDLADPIQAAYLSIRKNVVGMASALGIGTEKLKGFRAAIEVSTKGMTQEQAQEAVLKSLGVLGDKLSTAITGGVKSVSKAGETAMETLTRLSTSLTTANDAMKALGYDLFRVGFRGAAAASAMVDLYGGLDKFASVTDYYFQNFYSLAERTRYTAAQFAASVGAITSARVPQTAEQFRALIERLQEAGRLSAVARLMALAPMFNQLETLREELAGVGEVAGETGDALASAQAILDQRKGLEERLLTLQGNTAELRRRELEALYPANRALLTQILRLEDAAAAQARLDEITNERKGLEEQLLALQGNTAELRRRELAELDPANRALQRMIWGLEDAKAAIDDLKPERFKTLFAFNRASANLANAPGTQLGVTSIQPAQSFGGAGDNVRVLNAPRAAMAREADLAVEVKNLRKALEVLLVEANARATETAKATTSMSKNVTLWEGRGLPKHIA